MDKILAALKELKISEYRLVEETTYAKEWFFIQKKLDMSRAKKVRHYYLTIYQNIYEQNNHYKGSASGKITDRDDEETLKKEIMALASTASYVKNPYYELVHPVMEDQEMQVSMIGDIRDVVHMIQDFHETDEVSLNSCEIFENLTEVHLINSKGLDVQYSYPSHEVECIINAKDEHHEIEVYQDMRFGQPNIAELKQQLGEASRQALDRKNAVPLNKDMIVNRVILAKNNILILCRYYLYQLNVEAKYRHYSDVKIGDELGPRGFHLEGLPYLENSSKNKAYDDDGRPIKKVTLIDQGIVQNVWGNHMFSTYLDLTKTTMINNFKVAPGTMNMEEMHAEPYLEIVQFSDFSCDPFTGDFGGEIRLGYYYDGENVIPVSGGSISGNLKENEKTMVFSNELVKYDGAVIPSAVLLEHVNVAA